MSSFAAAVAVVALAGVAAAGAGATPTTAADAGHDPTTGFLAAPTEQLAVPGMAAGAEVTPEGDLYTGWAEYELRFGEGLRAWDQPTRTLPEPGVPLLSSTLADGPVRYTVTLFAVPVVGRPVAYETVRAVNGSALPRRARVGMLLAYTRGRQIRGPHGVVTGAYRYERPVVAQTLGAYEQPGQSFSPGFRYAVAGRDLDRSGLLLARGPAVPSRLLATPSLNTPTAAHGGRTFETRLGPHAGASFTWRIPLEPPPVGAARRPHTRCDAAGCRARGAALAVGRPGVRDDAHRSARGEGGCHLSGGDRADARIAYPNPTGWEQCPNRLQYRAFWIRDAAIETQALDLAGLHAAAAQNLALHRRLPAGRRPLHQPGRAVRRVGRGAVGARPARRARPGTGLRGRAARADWRRDRLAVGG